MLPSEPGAGNEVTRILRDWSGGDSGALERLTPIVYAELHRVARAIMSRERGDHVLQPSALVNEAFVRLIGGEPVQWEGRTQFFAFSARVIRQILFDFARAQQADKRGNRSPHLMLSGIDSPGVAKARIIDFIDLDASSKALHQLDDRQARVVELRYFGGMENDWGLARAFLFNRLQPQENKQ